MQLVGARKAVLYDELYRHLGGVVASGPFQGLKLSAKLRGNNVADLLPRLLGIYEAELHDVIRRVVRGSCRRLVNIGAAEGYYAVGLARLLPALSVVAFESDAEARAICRETAEVNGVAARIGIEGTCDRRALTAAVADGGGTLVLSDCEGAEKDLLDPEAVPALRRCEIVVECHDFTDRSITPTLRARFEPTHTVDLIAEGARNPNLFPILQRSPNVDRWIMVDEGRTETMHWLALRPRSEGP
jgi:hypothetical protein